MPPEIQFIVSTGNTSAESKKAQRRLVRSHVTAHRYQQKRQRDVKTFERTRKLLPSPANSLSPASVSWSENGKDEDEDEDPRSSSQLGISPFLTNDSSIYDANHDHDELRLEEDGGHLLQVYPALSPFAYIGNGIGDPFIRMYSPPSPRMSKHIFYYVNVLMPKMHPSYTTNLVRQTFGCKTMMYADELRLCAIAAFSATSRAMLAGDLNRWDAQETATGFHEGVFDWLYFKGKTIRLVNERLRDTKQAAADSTVEGIVDLILLETYTGNMAEATAHMQGLRSIAALRQKGGPMTYQLASKITAASIKHSTLTQSKPIIPFTLTSNITLPLPNISHMLPDLGTRLIEQWPHISANERLVSIFYDMARITRYTEAVFDWLFPYSEDDSYYEYINYENLSIEHRLLAHQADNLIEECCRLASILYANTVLVRGYPNAAGILRNTVKALKELLKSLMSGDAGLPSLWSPAEDVLFWVLFVGAYCSHQQVEEPFFEDALRCTASVLELASCEDAKALLSTLFFVERIYLERLESISKVVFY